MNGDNKRSYADRVKHIRWLATQGDPEAIAWVENQRARVRASAKKAREEGRSYDKTKHAKYVAQRDAGAAGDQQAAEKAREFRARKTKQTVESLHRTGKRIPRAAYLEQVKLTPEQLAANQAAYNRTYERAARAKLKAAAASGDPEAIAKKEALKAKNTEYHRRWREKKRASQQQ